MIRVGSSEGGDIFSVRWDGRAPSLGELGYVEAPLQVSEDLGRLLGQGNMLLTDALYKAQSERTQDLGALWEVDMVIYW